MEELNRELKKLDEELSKLLITTKKVEKTLEKIINKK